MLACTDTAGGGRLEELLKQHAVVQKAMVAGEKPMRSVIFFSHDGANGGGYGNRLIGIMSVILLGLIHDRAIILSHTAGFKLEDYYVGDGSHNIKWAMTRKPTKTINNIDNPVADGNIHCDSLLNEFDIGLASDTSDIGIYSNQDCFAAILQRYEKTKPGLAKRRGPRAIRAPTALTHYDAHHHLAGQHSPNIAPCAVWQAR